jgi:hypothetical protein
MIVLGLILSIAAVGFFCWLLFTLATLALPFFVAVNAAIFAYHHHAGVLGAVIVALLAGLATLAVGQIAFAVIRSPLFRGLLALAFAAPAALAGYYATFGLLHIGIASESWCTAFAVIGAAFVGATAFLRLAALTEPQPAADVTAVHS